MVARAREIVRRIGRQARPFRLRPAFVQGPDEEPGEAPRKRGRRSQERVRRRRRPHVRRPGRPGNRSCVAVARRRRSALVVALTRQEPPRGTPAGPVGGYDAITLMSYFAY